MSLLKYFKKDDGASLPSSKLCPSLTKPQLKGANESVKEVLTKDTNGQAESQIRRRDKYDNYTADDRPRLVNMKQRMDQQGQQNTFQLF